MKNEECRTCGRLASLFVLHASFFVLHWGCNQPLRTAEPSPMEAAGGPLPPTLERMRRAYPDLESGRFVVIADFNTAPQDKLLRVVGPEGTENDRVQPAITANRARDETGPGGLAAMLAGPGDRLILDGARSTELAIPRDWSGRCLLIMSLFGPPDGAAVELSVLSGDPPGARWSRILPASAGWNLLRVDLDELADAVDLRDIRALEWRLPAIGRPVEVFLDDIVLTDNTRELLARSGDGALYGRSQGKRVLIGAPGRFELAFAEGAIVGWRDADAAGRNLAARGGLGPWPAPLAEDWDQRGAAPVAYDDPAHFRRWGESVVAQQQLVELTPFRAVVRGTWRFVSDHVQPAAGAADQQPTHEWTYSIYPGGQVYVRVRSNSGAPGWRCAAVGYAIAVAGDAEFSRIPGSASPSAGEPPDAFVLLARTAAGQGDLLWSPAIPSAAARQLELFSADERRTAVIAGNVEVNDVVDTAQMLRFWPADLHGVPEARSLAGDYQSPAKLAVQTGRLKTDVDGDLNHDGFNECEGLYELAMDGSLLRFRVDPGRRLRHSPMFRVHGTGGRDAWVYSDGRIVRDVGRDARGNLLFRLDRAIGEAASVDVNLRAPAGGP